MLRVPKASTIRLSYDLHLKPVKLQLQLYTSRLKSTSAQFASLHDSQAFGQLVTNYHQDLNQPSPVRVVPHNELLQSSYRDASGQLPDGASVSKEARLHKSTLQGMMNREQVKIPERLTKTIYNHMLALQEPKQLKFEVAERYVMLKEEMLYKQTKKPHEVDSYIAAFFAQDYASVYQVLSELFKRRSNFKPKKILDIGFGPATGMLVLNELMGDEFEPKFKDAVIVGSDEMKSRAKLLLSRQLNEFTGDLAALREEGVDIEAELMSNFVGEVKTKKIQVRTQISSSLNQDKKYDLIIAQHQLLTDVDAFPYQVDDKVDQLLKLLEPEGVLVLVERGSPLGFENIARARQIMIRPENFEQEKGKIPRPYIKGSTYKSDPLQFEEVELQTAEEEAFFVDEDGNEVMVQDLETEMNLKFGDVDPKDLDFPDLTSASNEPGNRIDYHLNVIAPCSHHKRCPLQTLKPHYYTFPSGSKLNWCRFEKMLERPRYLMELKRGRVLSSKWQSPHHVSPTPGPQKSSGRENANNYEIANFSYLITERSANDSATLDAIAKAREQNSFDDSLGKLHGDSSHWPRIMRQPMKRKGHVTMELCGASGEIEKWTVTKSFDKQTYYDSRKAHSGDLWALDGKTKLLGRSNHDSALQGKLENYQMELLLRERKMRNMKDKLDQRESLRKADDILSSGGESTDEVIELYTNTFNSTKRQRQKDRRGGLITNL